MLGLTHMSATFIFAHKFEHTFLLFSSCCWKCSSLFLLRMCLREITTSWGCEQAFGQPLLPAVTILDGNMHFITYLKSSLLPGPNSSFCLFFLFSLHFCICWILLSQIINVKDLHLPHVMLDECQKVATSTSLYLSCSLPLKNEINQIFLCNNFYSLIY